MDKNYRWLFLIIKLMLLFFTFWPIKVLLFDDFVDYINDTDNILFQKIIIFLQIVMYCLYILFYVVSFFTCIKLLRRIIEITDIFFIIIGVFLWLKFTILAMSSDGEGAFVILIYPLIFVIIIFGVLSRTINKKCLK